jgi:death-on-curing protein
MSRRKKKHFIYMPSEDIIIYHELAISRHGGRSGLYPDTQNRIESVLAQQYYAGIKYRTIEARSAYLVYLINKGHLFEDGNKRTSLLTGMAFLELNGFILHATDEELEAFALRVASSEATNKDWVISQMTKWIGARLKRC